MQNALAGGVSQNRDGVWGIVGAGANRAALPANELAKKGAWRRARSARASTKV